MTKKDSVDQPRAGWVFQCRGEGAVFLAVGAGQRRNPAQMVLRLVAVALLDLPQSVILPRLDVIRIGLERALVPDLGDLVVAELAIGVADQIGDGGDVVMSERPELIDGGGIIVAL